MSQPLTTTLHWLGAGLSSPPGIRYLAEQGAQLILWNRSVGKAEQILKGCSAPNAEVRRFTQRDLEATLRPGDIVVSMLPAGFHVGTAELCLSKGAHLVTASYLSPAMKQLDQAARSNGLCFVNEVGLDPGLDHWMAYEAVDRFRSTPHWSDSDAVVTFRSFCGGLSEIPNDFCYRFSWSPVGVLKALRSPCTFIRNGESHSNAKPWKETQTVTIESEPFEAYPNRDSLPFVHEYGLAQRPFRLDTFVRGSLRLPGWQAAWQPLFQQVGEASDETLESISQELWNKHAFKEGENDRVVLFVELTCQSPRHGSWRHESLIDHVGTPSGSAMAKLVSLPVAFTALAVPTGRLSTGVTGAPKIEGHWNRVFAELSRHGIRLSQKSMWA